MILIRNAQKGEGEAGSFLRKLYREGRLTVAELNGRLRALKELAAGKLKPEVEARLRMRMGMKTNFGR